MFALHECHRAQDGDLDGLRGHKRCSERERSGQDCRTDHDSSSLHWMH
jgi:hypothetical protein